MQANSPALRNIEHADACYQKAEKCYQAKEYDDARALYEEAMLYNPDHVEALFSLGWMHEHNQGCILRWRLKEDDLLMRLIAGRYFYLHPYPQENGGLEIHCRYWRDDVALIYYRKAAGLGHYQSVKRHLYLSKHNVNDADTWFKWGKEYDQEKNYAYARACFERVIALNPGHKMVYQWLGMIYENGNGVAKDYTQAKAYYQKYLALSKDDAELKRLERKMADGAEKRAGYQPQLGLFGGSPPGQTAVLPEAGSVSYRR